MKLELTKMKIIVKTERHRIKTQHYLEILKLSSTIHHLWTNPHHLQRYSNCPNVPVKCNIIRNIFSLLAKYVSVPWWCYCQTGGWGQMHPDTWIHLGVASLNSNPRSLLLPTISLFVEKLWFQLKLNGFNSKVFLSGFEWQVRTWVFCQENCWLTWQ